MWFSTSQLLQWSSLNQYILIQPIRSAVLPRECPNPLILALSQFSGQFRNDFFYYVTCSAWLSKQTVTRADTPVTFEKQPVHMVLITSAMSSRRSSEIWLGASLLPRTLLLSWTGVWPHWLSGSQLVLSDFISTTFIASVFWFMFRFLLSPKAFIFLLRFCSQVFVFHLQEVTSHRRQ